jgi:hypothetical protein
MAGDCSCRSPPSSRRPLASPASPGPRCGIDLGIGQEGAVIAHDATRSRAHRSSAPWAAVSNSAAGSPDSRRAGSSAPGAPPGERQAGGPGPAAVNLRRESIHTLTTSLARRYGTVVIEDLDIAAMGRGMGRRAFRRSLYEAGLGRVRPTLPMNVPGEAGSWWWPTGGSRFQIPLVRRRHRGRRTTLVDQHLIGGKPVEMFHIGPDDFCG